MQIGLLFEKKKMQIWYLFLKKCKFGFFPESGQSFLKFYHFFPHGRTLNVLDNEKGLSTWLVCTGLSVSVPPSRQVPIRMYLLLVGFEIPVHIFFSIWHSWVLLGDFWSYEIVFAQKYKVAGKTYCGKFKFTRQ